VSHHGAPLQLHLHCEDLAPHPILPAPRPTPSPHGRACARPRRPAAPTSQQAPSELSSAPSSSSWPSMRSPPTARPNQPPHSCNTWSPHPSHSAPPLRSWGDDRAPSPDPRGKVRTGRRPHPPTRRAHASSLMAPSIRHCEDLAPRPNGMARPIPALVGQPPIPRNRKSTATPHLRTRGANAVRACLGRRLRAPSTHPWGKPLTGSPIPTLLRPIHPPVGQTANCPSNPVDRGPSGSAPCCAGSGWPISRCRPRLFSSPGCRPGRTAREGGSGAGATTIAY
jgi:hypothetical protein